MAPNKKIATIPVHPASSDDVAQMASAFHDTLPSVVPFIDPVASYCDVLQVYEKFDDAVDRIQELFFTRTELISRSLSGSYSVQPSEALAALQRETASSSTLPSAFLQTLCDLPWDRLACRYRNVINRKRSKVPSYIQAEISLTSAGAPAARYTVYFNFADCSSFTTNVMTEYSYCIGFEPLSTGGMRVIVSVLNPTPGDKEKAVIFSEQILRGLVFWTSSGKEAHVNEPLSCVDKATYYAVLEDVRRDGLVARLSASWTNYEKTDKSKHLFEDVGIVAYLLTLFKERYAFNNTPIRFVDVGCGNGVVSFLLNSFLAADNGRGMGYDVKGRRIWEYYKTEIARNFLLAEPIVPSFPDLETPFPDETNFIIGIHTDELTPWLMVYAMRMRCGFFLLPCCPFDFFGRYAKRHLTGSKWEYFEYLKSLALALGFEIDIDVLKVPSEKKTAIIGRIPANDVMLDSRPDWKRQLESIMLRSYRANGCVGFQARSEVIPVKNCSKIPFAERDEINRAVVGALLTATEPVPLKDVISVLTEQQMKWLKAQDGGLQTFIKNHRQGYLLSNGKVALRRDVFEKGRLPKRSKLPCFAQSFLPGGCTLRDICGYEH